MSENGIVNIHGKSYVTVARRVEMLHEDKDTIVLSIDTEVIKDDPVVTKTTVRVKRLVTLSDGKTEWVEQVYTGISAANPIKIIEKQSPYEVAETSSCGRALGFAGYGSVDSIASADEMVKAGAVEAQGKPSTSNQEIESVLDQEESTGLRCEKCGAPAEEKSGTTKAGKAWRGIMCSTQDRTHTRWMYD